MPKLRNGLSLLAILIISTPAAIARNAADLSGAWVINQKQSRRIRPLNLHLPKAPPFKLIPDGRIEPTDRPPLTRPLEVQTRDLNLLIRQTDTELQVTRKFKKGLTDKTVIQKFLLDGTQSRNPDFDGGGEFTSSSSFKDDKLLNVGRRVDGSRKMLLKEEYALAQGGNRLIIETSAYFAKSGENRWTRTAQKPDMIFRQVFDRK